MRAIGVADINQDQKRDLLISDGWHFQYGTNAQARVVLYEGPDFAERRVIAILMTITLLTESKFLMMVR